MTTPSPARVVFEEMNRDPGKFYPMETCALAVRIISSRVIIPVDMPSLVTHIEGIEKRKRENEHERHRKESRRRDE